MCVDKLRPQDLPTAETADDQLRIVIDAREKVVKSRRSELPYCEVASFRPEFDCFHTSFSQQKFNPIFMMLRLASLRWKGDNHSSHCTRVCPVRPYRNRLALMFFQCRSDCKWMLRAWQVDASPKSHVEGNVFPPHSMTSLALEYSSRWGRICQSFLWNRDSPETNTRLPTMLSFKREGREEYQGMVFR